MKNLKEIKLMMERLESPRMTQTEVEKKKKYINENYNQDELIDRIIQMDTEFNKDPLYKKYEDEYTNRKITKMLQMKMGLTEVPKEMVDSFIEMGKIFSGSDDDGNTTLTPERVVSQKDSVLKTSEEILDLTIEHEEYSLSSKIRDFINLLKQVK